MLSIIGPIVALLAEIAPAVSTSSAIGNVIATLTALIPAIVKEANDLIPTVKNVIATLKGSDAITPEQLDALDAIEAKIDADYDAASAAAKTEDDAADASAAAAGTTPGNQAT